MAFSSSAFTKWRVCDAQKPALKLFLQGVAAASIGTALTPLTAQAQTTYYCGSSRLPSAASTVTGSTAYFAQPQKRAIQEPPYRLTGVTGKQNTIKASTTVFLAGGNYFAPNSQGCLPVIQGTVFPYALELFRKEATISVPQLPAAYTGGFTFEDPLYTAPLKGENLIFEGEIKDGTSLGKGAGLIVNSYRDKVILRSGGSYSGETLIRSGYLSLEKPLTNTSKVVITGEGSPTEIIGIKNSPVTGLNFGIEKTTINHETGLEFATTMKFERPIEIISLTGDDIISSSDTSRYIQIKDQPSPIWIRYANNADVELSGPITISTKGTSKRLQFGTTQTSTSADTGRLTLSGDVHGTEDARLDFESGNYLLKGDNSNLKGKIHAEGGAIVEIENQRSLPNTKADLIGLSASSRGQIVLGTGISRVPFTISLNSVGQGYKKAAAALAIEGNTNFTSWVALGDASGHSISPIKQVPIYIGSAGTLYLSGNYMGFSAFDKHGPGKLVIWPSSSSATVDFELAPGNGGLLIRDGSTIVQGRGLQQVINLGPTTVMPSGKILLGSPTTSQGEETKVTARTINNYGTFATMASADISSQEVKNSGNGTFFINGGSLTSTSTIINQGTVFSISDKGRVTGGLTNGDGSSPSLLYMSGEALLEGSIWNKSKSVLQFDNPISDLSKSQIIGNVQNKGEVKGNGTIKGSLFNEGSVSPGNSIGTLVVDGDYFQGVTNPNASLNIEVDGSTSDLLKITGDNRTILLGGNLKISSYNNAAVSPGHIYTAIDVTGNNATGGEIGLKTNLNVVGSSGMKFVRETDREFRLLDPAYYATCTSNDPAVQVGCTKLQFAWLKVHPDTGVAVNPDRHKTPGQSTINYFKKTGGALTTASSGNSSTNTNTCIANGGTAASCKQQNKTGSGSGAANSNSTNTAKTLDAGWASLGAAVSSGVTGGSAIGTTGYTTNQTSAALVTPDFANVIAAFFSIPTRVELNQALHSITAEPYASMQSVALEAMEQFGKNSLALTDRAVPLTHTQTFCKLDDGSLVPADSPERPDTCDERDKTVGSRWSLLLDGSNTEASLNGTTELASLDYNVFSTIYGLQYAFSPQWSAGAAFGYGQARLYNYEYANTHINADTYGGSIWGIYRPTADWKISGLLGYMNLQYDSTRQMAFGGLNRTANANWDGNGFTTALEAQYNWALNGNNSDPDAIRLKPRTFLSYAVHNQGSFSESGAQSLNLAVDSHTADSVLWGLGFTLETPIRVSSSSRIIPRFTVGYEHDFMGSADEEHQLSSSFSELPALGSMDVLGQNRGADALDLGLSIEIETSDSVSLYAAVNGGFWSNGNEISYGGGLKYSW